jgi:hypothetical protein
VCTEIGASLFHYSGEACSNCSGSGSGSNARVDGAGFRSAVGSSKCASHFEWNCAR